MASGELFWQNFEEFLGYQFPNEVKSKLIFSGFDSEIALLELSPENILLVEKFQAENFMFLPGHRALLMGLPEKIKEYIVWKKENKPPTFDILKSADVSFIMKELVRTALNNRNVEPKRRRYSESIRNFALYLYMMCGKAAYEVLSNNIPLPHPSTVCK